MRQHNAENERVKREYLIYLKVAKGLSEASLPDWRPMSPATIFLGRLPGLYLVAISIGMLVNRRRT